MNKNLTAVDELAHIYQEKCMKMLELVDKYLPNDEYMLFFGLYHQLVDIAEILSSKTDDEIERMRYQELIIHPICPICEERPDWSKLSIPLVLDKLCGRRDCAEFKTCWASEYLEPPVTVLRLTPEQEDKFEKDWKQYLKLRDKHIKKEEVGKK